MYGFGIKSHQRLVASYSKGNPVKRKLTTQLPGELPKPLAGSNSTMRASLDRRSPLPLYAQVERRLKAMISAGEYPSTRFHSELEICKMLGVSRATARQAMQNLAAEGWLLRQRGHGSFVNPAKFDESFNTLMNLPDQWAKVGRPLEIRLTRFEIAKCPAHFAAMLGIDRATPVLCVERARAEGPAVISYDHRFVHPDFAHGISREQAASSVPLLEVLRRMTRLCRAENRVEASLAGGRVARLLGVGQDDAVLVRETVYYGESDMPVICGRSYYRADKVRCAFTVDMTSESASSGQDVLYAVSDAGEIPSAPRPSRRRGQPSTGAV